MLPWDLSDPWYCHWDPFGDDGNDFEMTPRDTIRELEDYVDPYVVIV